MSDDWIRLIPTQATWEPASAAAEAATAHVKSLFAAPVGTADEVAHTFHGEVALIDSGVNTESVRCPACDSVIDLGWVFDVVDARSDDLSNLEVCVPCCGAGANLNDLDYDWPMGFARFEIGVFNGSRDRYELDQTEPDQVGSFLGHAVRQVLAHY